MNIGFGELLFIFALALILFGPKRLPKAARDWGKMVYQIKNKLHSFLDFKE